MIHTRLRWSGFIALAAYIALPTAPKWPEPNRGVAPVIAAVSLLANNSPTPADDADDALVESQPVCVGSRAWSAGALGSTVLYRVHRSGRSVEIGYFVYWSTERPWGNNALSYAVLPALFTDAFYSHFMYVFPGVKDYLYGSGDVEGARVEFEERADGTLDAKSGHADDGTHHPVVLTRADLMDAKGRVVLLTDVWSHQLGAHGGAAFAAAANAELRCYGRGEIHPLTESVVQAFRLGNVHAPRRANPAWIDSSTDGRLAFAR